MNFYHAMHDFFHQWNLFTILFRLVLAMIFGGSVGLMRSLRRRNAGFKTHAVVCIGATLIMLTGEFIYMEFDPVFDVSRLAAQVVSGVGFLGVGTIIVTGKNHIMGLTTAAGLWTCAGIGIALGIGFYSGALITTVIILIIYRFLENMDDIAASHASIMHVRMVLDDKKSIAPVIARIRESYRVDKVDVNKPRKAKGEIVSLNLVLDVGPHSNHRQVANEIMAYEGVILVEEI